MIKQTTDEYLEQKKALHDKFLGTLKHEYSKFIMELFDEHRAALMNRIHKDSEYIETQYNSVFIDLESVRVDLDRQGFLTCCVDAKYLGQTRLTILRHNLFYILEPTPIYAKLSFLEPVEYLSDEKFKTSRNLNRALSSLEHYTCRAISCHVYPNVKVECIKW